MIKSLKELITSVVETLVRICLKKDYQAINYLYYKIC